MNQSRPAASNTRKTMLQCAAAALVYGVMNFFSGRGYLPGCSFAELRPQIAIPMFMGFAFGPLAGFAVGCFGDSLGYTLAGYGPLYAWNWSIGNGLIGLLPAFGRPRGGGRFVSIRHFEIMLLCIGLASSLPILFAIVTDRLRLGPSNLHDALFKLFIPIFITDSVLGVMLVPLLLMAARRMVMTIETRTMLFVTYLLGLTVLGTYAGSIGATILSRPAEIVYIQDLYTVGILCLVVMIIGLASGAYFSKRLTAPVVELSLAAAAMRRGEYHAVPALTHVAAREDELGQLAGLFESMIAEVSRREESLKQEVRELRIEIDRAQQRSEVARITSSNYFQMLREKAAKLRLQDE